MPGLRITSCQKRSRVDGSVLADSFPDVSRFPYTVAMNLILHPETIAICKLVKEVDPSDWRPSLPLHASIVDGHGRTLICNQAAVKGNEKAISEQSPWRCFQIDAVMDFTVVGVMSNFSGLLASAHIPLMAVCSFETDYLLVPPQHVEAAIKIFETNGHSIERPNPPLD